MGRTPFKLKSGNNMSGSSFKMMGSSPVKAPEDEDEVTWGEEEIVGTETIETPESTDVRTDYQTKGTKEGKEVEEQLDPNDPVAVAAWKAASEESKAKYRTSEVSKERSETVSKPKEQTPQQKMAKGKHHSKYWDPGTKSYRVKEYGFKQLPSGKYTSSGRGKQTGDISLAEWKKQNPELSKEGTEETKF